MYIPLLIPRILELDGLANLPFSLLGIGCFIGGFVMAVKKKNKWDIVIVETRGGKQVYFSVDDGNGIETVDAIENEKRKYIK
jgi:threonine dehydratase